jgi:hypothetical protein
MREFAFRLEADTEPRFWQLMRTCTPSCARVRILPNLPDQSLRRTRDWDRPFRICSRSTPAPYIAWSPVRSA